VTGFPGIVVFVRATAFAAIVAFAIGAAAPRAGAAQENKNTESKKSHDPRARWNSLSEEERDHYRKLFSEFQRLPESERDALKQRQRVFGEERKKLEDRLTADERAMLAKMKPEERESWLRSATAEVLRERDDRVKSLIPKEKLDRTMHGNPSERKEGLRKLSEEASNELVRRAIESAIKRKMITPLDGERLRALGMPDALRAAASLRKQMIISDIDADASKRAEIGEELWGQIKKLDAEPFLQRMEVWRALRRSSPRGDHEGGWRGDGPPPHGGFDKDRHGPPPGKRGPHGGPRPGGGRRDSKESGPASRKGI
jgi:hypothetical protein